MNPYKRLLSDIENALHHTMKTPKDFDFLRERIYARLHTLISQSTLMRLWGYVSQPVEPRISTLDTLAQFLGYQDWSDYERNAQLPADQQSSPILNRRLNTRQLHQGEQLRLLWRPNKVCDIEYQGNNFFRVIHAENTRLHAGDTFECLLFIEDEPLYLDNLHHAELPPMAYVCGKKSGIKFEYLMPE